MNKKAYAAGYALGMQKSAEGMDQQTIALLSMLGGGALGGLGGAASTPEDKEGNRSKLSMLLRALLFGAGGAALGGMGPGLVAGLGAEGGPSLEGVLGSMGESLGGGLSRIGETASGAYDALDAGANAFGSGYKTGLKS